MICFCTRDIAKYCIVINLKLEYYTKRVKRKHNLIPVQCVLFPPSTATLKYSSFCEFR